MISNLINSIFNIISLLFTIFKKFLFYKNIKIEIITFFTTEIIPSSNNK